MSEIDIWSEVLRPHNGDLSAAHAKYILDLEFSPTVIRKYRRLADKAQDGTLSQNEESELDNLIAVNTVISLLRSKARQLLRTRRRSAFRVLAS